ncbi:MAG: GNAT family N-acetyltransferase, partial [Rhodoferax sp.]|nr:GNAT family N-acetyltransferase [Rhodoferax sp.]
MLEIVTPQSPADLTELRQLLREYAAILGVDPCFQDFDSELLQLPGDYSGPRGSLVTANVVGELAGCCVLRRLHSADYPNAGEKKRLHVRTAFRGRGLGSMLAEAILDRARQTGYTSVLLNTLSDMETAPALYTDLGFVEIPPYYHNPIPGSHSSEPSS